MKDILVDNAFGILGILPDSSQKEISRRGKEIIKLLKFGEPPSYDFDFDFYSRNRDEETVSASLNELSSIKTHILHSFFRVLPISKNEKNKIIDYQKLMSIDEQLSFLSKDTSIKDKNRIVLLLILLYKTNEPKDFNPIMSILLPSLSNFMEKRTILSDFKKIYKLTDEFGVDDKIFKDLRESLCINFAQIFSNIAQAKHNKNLLFAPLKFLLPGLSAFNNIPILRDFLQEVENALVVLEKSSPENFKRNDTLLKQNLKKIESLFNKSINMNIFDSSVFLNYRDKFCSIMYSLSVDYFNTTSDVNIALGLVRVAQGVGGTLSTEQKLKEAAQTLLQVKKDETEPFAKLYLKKNSLYPAFYFYRTRVEIYTKFLWNIHRQSFQYDDIDGYAFSLTKNFFNGIPTNIVHQLKIVSHARHFDYSCVTSAWSRDDSKKTDFYIILNAFDNIIKPLLIKKIVHLIFELKQNYIIGALTINQSGITKRSFTKSILYWDDINYHAFIEAGEVIILDKNGQYFANISLSTINAPLLPDLIDEIISQRAIWSYNAKDKI